MNIGTRVTTLATVRPPKYANKVGAVVTVNEGEYGVLVDGRLVWFREREITECQGSTNRAIGTGPQRGVGFAGNSGLAPTRGARSSVRGTAGTVPVPLVIDLRPDLASGPQSPPGPVSAAPAPAEGLSEGSRGPAGGIIARCGVCGRLWERERRRGRPAKVCGECAR